MRFRMGIKAGSVCLAFALLTTSCSSSKPEASLTELIDRVCTVMEPIGYDFTDSTIQALDESVQQQLLDDISKIKELSPSSLEIPLRTLCS
ncbi:MAG: hypothetical protein NTW43_04165 [Actinobacteria bacterium]|nr:hypothetical protein [Actinomycetota bacterium]